MGKKVKVDEMAATISEYLTEYSENVTEIAKNVVDEMSENVMKEVKKHITWKDKVYSKNFALKTAFEDSRNKRRVWYVKSPHYRLTHLLEFGHATRNGGRTRSFPHVKYGNDYLLNNFDREMKEAIENARIEGTS